MNRFLSNRKLCRIWIAVLFFLVILLPVGVLLSSAFGYEFTLVNGTLFAAFTALVAIGAVILCRKGEAFPEDPQMGIFIAQLSPLSLLNAGFFLLKVRSGWVAICMFLCIGCCFWLSWQYGRPKVLKYISLVIAMVLVLPIGFLGFLTLVFGGIGQNTVVQSVESPNGAYYAEVIDSDQGALGGDTFVEVHETGGIRNFLFVIEKEPRLVYLGEWGEFQDMTLHWKNETCLVINGAEYEIDE